MLAHKTACLDTEVREKETLITKLEELKGQLEEIRGQLADKMRENTNLISAKNKAVSGNRCDKAKMFSVGRIGLW